MSCIGEKKPYSEKEKLLLAYLVKDKGVAIENKKTDGTSLMEKAKTWDLITDTYNIQPEVGVKRTPKQLKKLWDNLKQKKRKLETTRKYSCLLTGGGPPEKDKEDPLMDIISEAAPHMDITLDNEWDSTATYKKNIYTNTLDLADEMNLPGCSGFKNTPTLDKDSQKTPTGRKRPIGEVIEVECDTKNTPKTSEIDLLKSASRKKSCEDEARLRVEKINEALQQQRELHALRMRSAELEHKSMCHLEETHKLKLKTAQHKADLAELKLRIFKIKEISIVKH